ncbi:MAG: ATP-binding protein [Candidatus Zixiibacteriota bacterium]
MPKPQKYESQLHLGLMAIIIVLLLLCMASNYVLYRQRGMERNRVEQNLHRLCFLAAEQLEIRTGVIPSHEQIESTRQAMNLTTLSIMPHQMSPDSSNNMHLNAERTNGLALVSIGRETVGEIQSGDAGEFLMLSEVATKLGTVLLVSGAQFPDYQLLIQASDVLFYASLAGLIVLGILYSTVTRVITAPFERLKRNARQAGRVGEEETDIEAVINDYECLVAELRERESELKELNRLNQQKADTLEHFNRYLLKSLVSGVITLDRSGTILAMNQAATDLLAVEGESWVGKNMTDYPRYCDPIIDLVMVSSQIGKNEPYKELVIVPTASQASTIGITVSVVYDADDSCIGFSILLNDLGEISRLRHELQKKEQLAALGEMAGGLAHQLRNALGSARGYSRLVEKKIRTSGDCGDSLEKLGDELKQTEQLVSRFLDFARPLHVIPEVFDISKVMEEIVHSFAVRDDCRVIQFDLQCREPFEVSADTLLLKQAVTNVMENAVKSYQGRAGRVAVAVHRNHGSANIEISDDGEGIEQANIDKVFMPFFTTRTDGTGLGLPLAKKIVDLHDGRLTIQSSRGGGTTVQIVLPMTRAPRRAKSTVSTI